MSITCRSCGIGNLPGDDACKNCGLDLTDPSTGAAATTSFEKLLRRPLRVMDLSNVHAIPADTPLRDAVLTLGRQKLDILAVVEARKLVGLLSVRDIITRVGADYEAKLHLPVRDFMTESPQTLEPDAPIAFALNRMDDGGFRHVPVVHNGTMVGVVSTRDVIRYLVKHS